MDEFERIKAAVRAARPRLPASLGVEDVLFFRAVDQDGNFAPIVRLMMAEPAADVTADVFWETEDVLREAIEPVSPGTFFFMRFTTRAELEEMVEDGILPPLETAA